jgi:hypothetical protein
MPLLRCLALIIGLMLLIHEAARAQTGLEIQRIVQLGDRVGAFTITRDGYFEVGALNDNTHLTVVTANAAGGDLLLRYADGQLTPLIAGGMESFSSLKWPQDVFVLSPVDVNREGNIVVAAGGTNAPQRTSTATLLWDAATKKFIPVATQGMPDVFDLTFERGGNWLTTINNQNEVAFVAAIAGRELSGDLLRTRDNRLVPIALPDQRLPDGSVVLDACNPSLNDAGGIAFVVRRKGDGEQAFSAYRWENGNITPVVLAGVRLADGRRFGSVLGIWTNNRNRSLLLASHYNGVSGPIGLDQFVNGQLTSIVRPGQVMPEGGRLKTVQDFGVSFANDLGQHAFLAALEDGSTAAYLLNEDNTLSLLLKSGMTTSLGLVTNVGQGAGTSSGIAHNGRGQVALTVRFGTGPDTVVLLSPRPTVHDLAIESVQIAPRVSRRAGLPIRVTITNRGTQAEMYSLEVRVQPGHVLLLDRRGSIAAGEQKVETVAWPPALMGEDGPVSLVAQVALLGWTDSTPSDNHALQIVTIGP